MYFICCYKYYHQHCAEWFNKSNNNLSNTYENETIAGHQKKLNTSGSQYQNDYANVQPNTTEIPRQGYQPKYEELISRQILHPNQAEQQAYEELTPTSTKKLNQIQQPVYEEIQSIQSVTPNLAQQSTYEELPSHTAKKYHQDQQPLSRKLLQKTNKHLTQQEPQQNFYENIPINKL